MRIFYKTIDGPSHESIDRLIDVYDDGLLKTTRCQTGHHNVSKLYALFVSIYIL